MARIAGVNVPTNKRLEISLTYIYGIGPKFSKDICTAVGIDTKKLVSELNEEQIIKIREFIESNFLVEGDLRREVSSRIKRLTDLGMLQRIKASKKITCKRSENTYKCKN